MSPTNDAVRAVAEAALASSSSSKVASSLVAAAVRAAMSISVKGMSKDPLVDTLVEDRMNMLRPALKAQTEEGLKSGHSAHAPRGLASSDDCLRANAARHVAFDRTVPLSTCSVSTLKRLQCGRRHKVQPETTARKDSDNAATSSVVEEAAQECVLPGVLLGDWTSLENPCIQVLNLPCGVFAAFTDSHDKLHRVRWEDGQYWLNGFCLISHSADHALWRDPKDDEEISWSREAKQEQSEL